MKQKIQVIVFPLLMILHWSCSFSQEKKSEQVSATWTKLAINPPPTIQQSYSIAYNTSHKRIVAYGGRTGFKSDFQNVNETWGFDYQKTIWVNLEPKNSPPWRVSHSMVYDPVGDKIIMFGGDDFKQGFKDLWSYDYFSNLWTNITPDYSPGAREMHGMVYVPGREVIIMVGGRRHNGGAAYFDIWELNCKTYTWRKLNPENNPKVSDHVNITYDLSAKKVLLYLAPEIWAYDLNANDWTQLMPDNKPNLDHSSFLYDPKHNKSILFGNIFGKEGRFTWVFDYSRNNWTNITPQNMINVRIEHDGMVYLQDEQVFIQHGGCCSNLTLELKINQ